jgi:hypothetical protein
MNSMKKAGSVNTAVENTRNVGLLRLMKEVIIILGKQNV